MMNIQALYPATFDGTAENYTAFMRSILIKGSYDSVLKKMTGYKGMYVCQHPKECWTLKFDQFEGIFGVVFSEIYDGFGTFALYYFPSPNENLIERFSVLEGLLAQEENFIDKVRSFASDSELSTQFYIGSLRLHVNIESQTMFLCYETCLRQRVYAKEGVFSPWKKDECIIEAGGLDKDLPSFRLVLPFMNFFNTAITRLTCNAPSYFQLFKARDYTVAYNAQGRCEKMLDSPATKLFIALGYGDGVSDALIKPIVEKAEAQVILAHMSLNSFLQKAPWYDQNESMAFLKPSISQRKIKPTLVVVTGFLGSGKTNFLQNYIEYETEKNHFIGIIQNEIGKTGLDGKLVDYDYSLVEIDEGCVCCSLSGQLRMGVNTLMKKTTPDTILLETTGVANPFNLLSELHELEDLVDLEAIVTVVDGTNALFLAKEYRIFIDQIRSADIILLNKTDLMSATEIEKVEQFLYENNRCAKVIQTVQCDIHPNALRLSLNASTAQIASLIAEEDEVKYTHTHDHLSSIKVALPKALNKEQFEIYLDTLPQNIYRLKGIVGFENELSQYVVQYVRGHYEFVEQQREQRHETFLVYIGKDLDKCYLSSPY
ncbi:CobW family GTP-binding protein [Sulfurospirillum multivorans]|nr:GTP-binding protein [Sulfurospirillum multivorans]